YFSHSRSEILPFVPALAKKCLDVGCGEGTFAELLQRERGCEVTGIEPSLNAYTIAKAKLHQAYNCSVEDFFNGSPDDFDVIFFNDVLEHLVDPWSILRLSRKFV